MSTKQYPPAQPTSGTDAPAPQGMPRPPAQNRPEAEQRPEPMQRLFGKYADDPKKGLSAVTGKVSGFFKRIGLHVLALISAFIIADGNGFFAQAAFFYLGAVSFLPRGFSPKQNDYLVPGAVSAGQMIIMLLMGYNLPLALFLAGVQTWFMRALIRRFGIGFDWLAAPFLLGFFVHAVRSYEIPAGLIGITCLCGLGAYYAATALDKRKREKMAIAARLKFEAESPFFRFHVSIDELEQKTVNLPAFLHAHNAGIVMHSRNIIKCMEQDQMDVQPGTRFLGRYLPAAHKIVDDYIRLAREGCGHEHIEKVLGRVDDIMARLSEAFQQEHMSLLRNDAMQLSAEMQVLDKLLKMDGR